MPVCVIEAPLGATAEAKKLLVEQATAALDAAYHIPDVRIFIREYPAENVGQDGTIGAEAARPVCFVEAPALRSVDAKRQLAERLNSAVAEAYGRIADPKEILVLHNEYPLENAALAGRLQSENANAVGALQALNG